MKKPPVSHIGAYIPTTEAQRLRDLAKINDRSVSAEIRRALKAWIEAHPTANGA